MRQSAGHVAIYSELGEGTTVKIYLPRYLGAEDRMRRAATGRAMKPGRSAPKASWSSRTTTRFALTRSRTERSRLQRAGGAERGRRSRDPRSGRRHRSSVHRHRDARGHERPPAGGRSAVRRRPGLKVLFTTGYTRNAIVHHGRLDPGVQMIGKPFSFDELGAKDSRAARRQGVSRSGSRGLAAPVQDVDRAGLHSHWRFAIVNAGKCTVSATICMAC